MSLSQAGIVAMIVLSSLAAPSSMAFSQAPRPSPGLKLSIKSEKASYGMGGAVQMELEFLNTGERPVLWYRELGAGIGRTNIRVLDEHGRDVVTEFLADELPPPPRPGSTEGFVEIKKGESCKSPLTVSLKELVNRPGTYEVFIEYTSTISKAWAQRYLRLPVDRIWTRDRGMIVSNHIRITVTN
jgi:hypothetical protein